MRQAHFGQGWSRWDVGAGALSFANGSETIFVEQTDDVFTAGGFLCFLSPADLWISQLINDISSIHVQFDLDLLGICLCRCGRPVRVFRQFQRTMVRFPRPCCCISMWIRWWRQFGWQSWRLEWWTISPLRWLDFGTPHRMTTKWLQKMHKRTVI